MWADGYCTWCKTLPGAAVIPGLISVGFAVLGAASDSGFIGSHDSGGNARSASGRVRSYNNALAGSRADLLALDQADSMRARDHNDPAGPKTSADARNRSSFPRKLTVPHTATYSDAAFDLAVTSVRMGSPMAMTIGFFESFSGVEDSYDLYMVRTEGDPIRSVAHTALDMGMEATGGANVGRTFDAIHAGDGADRISPGCPRGRDDARELYAQRASAKGSGSSHQGSESCAAAALVASVHASSRGHRSRHSERFPPHRRGAARGARPGQNGKSAKSSTRDGWVEIELRMSIGTPNDPDQAIVRLLRPAAWLAYHGAHEGAVISVELEELNVRGDAYVTYVGAGPSIAPGARCPVTGLVRPREVTMSFTSHSETRPEWRRSV